MNDNEFGLALAEAVNRELGVPVEFVHDSGDLWLGEKGATERASVHLGNFKIMHEQGLELAAIARKLARFWNAGRNAEPLEWEAIRERIVPHVVAGANTSYLSLHHLSPVLRIVAAVDGQDFLRFVLPRDLERLGVSLEVVRETAALNIARVLAGHPGDDTTSFIDGSAVVVFEGDLASDRAYTYAKGLPNAAAAFLSPEFAIVTRDTSGRAISSLAILARVGHDGLNLPHPFPPLAHVFDQGSCLGLAGALEESEAAAAEQGEGLNRIQ
jgi:hypothetical protein